ncbi:MAG TPA: winged helix-turn-helix domain-containing protein [Terriglobia bacterium]|nr:winged helix-turn-helix domain-containing protein [Terriglobia bacterium]
MIPKEELNKWARELDVRIVAIQGQIGSLQKELTDLQRKRAAIEDLTGNGTGSLSKDKPALALGGSELPPSAAGKVAERISKHAPYMDYWPAILKVLVEMEGKGHLDDILPRVKQKMEAKGLLGPIDYEDVPSGAEERWRNTARWQRKAMADRGLLRVGSPRGIWEITDEGRAWLQKNTR